MEITQQIDAIPPLKRGKLNIYNPGDIKRWGVEHFMDEVCSKEIIRFPNFGFTEEEDRTMDLILEEERNMTKNDF